MDKIEEYLTKLGFEPYYKLPLVQKLSNKTKQKPSMLILGFLIIFTLLALSSFGGNLITTLFAFLIPAFQTFKALETKDDKEDDERMLTYWIVFGFLYGMDEILRVLFSFIPFYHVIRYVILVFIYVPKLDGGRIIYRRFLRPLFIKFSSKIDKYVDSFEQKT